MGLTHTSFSEDGLAPTGTARGYSDLGDGDIYDLTEFRLGAGMIDGGVISTADDLTVFGQTLLAQDFLVDPWLSQMKKEVDVDGEDTHYGLGLQVKRDSDFGRAFGMQSVALSYQGQFWYLPDSKLTVSMLVNGGLGVLQDRAIQLSNDELAPLLLSEF